MQSSQTLLTQYLNLRPYRAVQRLLQQNSLVDSLQIYNQLQQTIKQNTLQLRTVLYNKHQNLHECSQAISKIKKFTQKIKQIQQEIDILIHVQPQDSQYQMAKHYSNNPLNVVQQLIYEEKYTQALVQCKKLMSKQKIIEENVYYVKFLKVQIIQKLEKTLSQASLSKQKILQSISSIKQFMQITSIQQILLIIQKNNQGNHANPNQISDQAYSLFDLIYQKYQQNQQQYPLKQAQIIQIIFKFKLFSLKNYHNESNFVFENEQERIQILYDRIFRYFYDIKRILEDSKQIVEGSNGSNQGENQQNKILCQILIKNIKTTTQQISQLFIRDAKKQQKTFSQKILSNPINQQMGITLSFQHQLYEKLLRSSDFMTILEQISNYLENSGARKVEQTNVQMSQDRQYEKSQYQKVDLKSMILNLWSDYYHQLLDIITQKINPINFYKLASGNPQNIPIQNALNIDNYNELKKFASSSKLKQSKLKLQLYEKQLITFFNNFNQLIVKSKNSQEKNLILQYFLKLKGEMERQIQSCLQRELSIKERKANNIDCLNLNKDTDQAHSSKSSIQLKTLANEIQQHNIKQILLLYLIIETYNSHWSSLNHYHNSTTNHSYRELLNSVAQQKNLNTNYQLNIFLFSTQNTQSTSFQISTKLFKCIDNLIQNKLARKIHLKNTPLYIQNWQIQLDKLFSSYEQIIVNYQNGIIVQPFRNLILFIVHAKLQQLK